MPFQDEVYLIADELRSIANAGAFYAGNEYDRERYDRALSLSARLVAAIEERPAGDVMEEYKQKLMHVAPLVGADAVVFRDGGMLLIKREDNGLWAIPGGATDADFFPEDDLPALSPGHERRVPMAFKLARGELPVPYFDSTP